MFNPFNRNKARVTITSINLKTMGSMHSIAGRQVPEKVFTLSIPFANKAGSDLVPEQFKRPSIRVNNPTVSAPFALVAVDPAPPLEVEYKDKVMLKIKIKAPEEAYHGPMTIDFGTNTQDMVHLSVTKIVLSSGARREDIAESGFATSVQKSQLFKKDLQMYKVLKKGDTVSKVTVSQPFELVGTEPKLPAVADTDRSYVLSIYVKAPTFNYAGPLEVSIN